MHETKNQLVLGEGGWWAVSKGVAAEGLPVCLHLRSTYHAPTLHLDLVKGLRQEGGV